MAIHPNIYGIIMAGGIGSRFWPMSRPDRPKQLLDIMGTGRTMIAETFNRLEPIINTDHFYVMTGRSLSDAISRQLPSLPFENILTEPERRNTAPCLAYAAYKIYANDPDAIMLVTPADHYIADTIAFRQLLQRAISYVSDHEALLTIGIHPTYPATGYGYIELPDEKTKMEGGPIVCFTEKPDRLTAERMLSTGRYLWNSGMFIWRVRDIIAAFERYLPDVASNFSRITSFGTAMENDDVAQVFLASPSVSIDFGVMEKASNVHVLPGDFGWDDIGTWTSLARHSKDVKEDHHHLINSPKTFIKTTDPNKRVIVEGLDDYIVVDTEDTLMIVPKKDEAHLHDLINQYSKENG